MFYIVFFYKMTFTDDSFIPNEECIASASSNWGYLIQEYAQREIAHQEFLDMTLVPIIAETFPTVRDFIAPNASMQIKYNIRLGLSIDEQELLKNTDKGTNASAELKKQRNVILRKISRLFIRLGKLTYGGENYEKATGTGLQKIPPTPSSSKSDKSNKSKDTSPTSSHIFDMTQEELEKKADRFDELMNENENSNADDENDDDSTTNKKLDLKHTPVLSQQEKNKSVVMLNLFDDEAKENTTFNQRRSLRIKNINKANKTGNKIQDLFETRPQDIEPIIPIINAYKDNIVYDPCCGLSVFKEVLVANGFNHIIERDLFTTVEKHDYYTSIDPEYDILITNPPYSHKKKFLTKAYESGKPFILLLPFDTLTRMSCRQLFLKYGVQVFILPHSITFLHNGNYVDVGPSAYFAGNFNEIKRDGNNITITYLPSTTPEDNIIYETENETENEQEEPDNEGIDDDDI